MSAAVVWQVLTGKKTRVRPGEKSRFFDKAKTKYGGSFDDETVESVKSVFRIMPVFLTIIMYWAVYSQVRVIITVYFWSGGRVVQAIDKFGIQSSPHLGVCLLYTSPSPRDGLKSRMPSSA